MGGPMGGPMMGQGGIPSNNMQINGIGKFLQGGGGGEDYNIEIGEFEEGLSNIPIMNTDGSINVLSNLPAVDITHNSQQGGGNTQDPQVPTIFLDQNAEGICGIPIFPGYDGIPNMKNIFEGGSKMSVDTDSPANLDSDELKMMETDSEEVGDLNNSDTDLNSEELKMMDSDGDNDDDDDEEEDEDFDSDDESDETASNLKKLRADISNEDNDDDEGSLVSQELYSLSSEYFD